jgi:uncharacterized protein (DUF433 family)
MLCGPLGKAREKGLGVMNERIQIDPRVCHGKPVIRGTRVLVSTILGALGGGDSLGDVQADYPNVTEEDIRAALAFAGELSRFEEAPYEVAQS